MEIFEEKISYKGLCELLFYFVMKTEQDEKLSAVVLKYPCLYDKSKTDYKDNLVKNNAWKAVAEEIDFVEDGIILNT